VLNCPARSKRENPTLPTHTQTPTMLTKAVATYAEILRTPPDRVYTGSSSMMATDTKAISTKINTVTLKYSDSEEESSSASNSPPLSSSSVMRKIDCWLLKEARRKNARKLMQQKKKEEEMFLLKSIKLAEHEMKRGMVMDIVEEMRGGGKLKKRKTSSPDSFINDKEEEDMSNDDEDGEALCDDEDDDEDDDEEHQQERPMGEEGGRQRTETVNILRRITANPGQVRPLNTTEIDWMKKWNDMEPRSWPWLKDLQGDDAEIRCHCAYAEALSPQATQDDIFNLSGHTDLFGGSRYSINHRETSNGPIVNKRMDTIDYFVVTKSQILHQITADATRPNITSEKEYVDYINVIIQRLFAAAHPSERIPSTSTLALFISPGILEMIMC